VKFYNKHIVFIEFLYISPGCFCALISLTFVRLRLYLNLSKSLRGDPVIGLVFDVGPVLSVCRAVFFLRAHFDLSTRPPLPVSLGQRRGVFLKRDKKLNSKKGCRLAKFRKMGTSRPMNGREAWGRAPPAHPTGGRFQNYFQAPLEGLFANKKLFLFTKRPLTRARGHPAHPTGGRSGARRLRRGIPPVGRAGGCSSHVVRYGCSQQSSEKASGAVFAHATAL
jgi:hypothetical protein